MRPLCFGLVLLSAGVALADEYPKVVHHDGQACMQTLGDDGQVKEECQPEAPGSDAPRKRVLQPGTAPAPVRLTDTKHEASRVEADAKGARRGIAEVVGALVLGEIPSAIFTGVCLSSGCNLAGALATTAAIATVTGLAAGLFHLALDGQAGVGWGVLGSVIGTLLVFLAAIPVVASGSAIAYLLFAIFANVTPTLGAVIALEARDTSLRNTPEEERQSEAGSGGLVLGTF